jgi:hypothetical protein
MSVEISHLAYSARKASERDGFPPLKHGHALELIAAALGYASLAAYQAAVAAGDEAADLSDVAHVVLQVQSSVTRALELRPRAPSSSHLEWIRRAFAQCLPAAKLHIDQNWLYKTLVDLVDFTAVNDSDVSGEMAMSNCEGIREIYLPWDFSWGKLPPVGESHVVNIRGHIKMEVHEERPPIGQMISVHASIELQRLGQFVIAEPVLRIVSAKMLFDWGDDEDKTEAQPKFQLEQVLADELGLSVDEALQLVDFEPIELTGNSGDMVYGYEFNFSDLELSPLRDKLVERGQLVVQVGPLFYERVAAYLA